MVNFKGSQTNNTGKPESTKALKRHGKKKTDFRLGKHYSLTQILNLFDFGDILNRNWNLVCTTILYVINVSGGFHSEKFISLQLFRQGK
jgi:hypothetical protein